MQLAPIFSGGRVFADLGLSALVDISPPDPDNPRKNTDDRYPGVIADQRDAYRCDTVREVEDFWVETCDQIGKEPVWDSREVSAYINRARWLADCPDCVTGSYVWSQNPYMMCLACCVIFKVRHPAPAVAAAAIRLLSAREVVNCNWNAHQGETVDQLSAENRWLLNDPTVIKDGLWVPASVRPEG